MNDGMKQKIFRGGLFLALKQILSAALSLVSTLVVARILGPEKYGIVAISLGIFYFFKFIGRMGLHVYIVRQANITNHEVEQILSFYNTIGLLLCCIIWLTAPAFGWWTETQEVTVALRFLIPAIWFEMVGSAASSMLERNLDFSKVSLINAAAEISNYLLSVTLVVVYQSYLGAISGYLLQSLLFAILAHYFHPIKWRYRWHWKALSPAIKYGISYSLANWILNLKSLTIPLLVSRLAGVEAAGLANVSLRVVQKLLLLRQVIRNMSVSVMAKLVEDKTLVQQAISKAMLYQALLMGSVCAVFSGFASWVIPTLFGAEWLLSAQIFPLVGFSVVISALFDLHAALLYASNHNREVGYFNAVYIGCIWISCLILIPSLGIWGYAIAEVSALPSYYVIHRSLSKFYQAPNYWATFWTVLATIPPLFGGIWLSPLPNLALMLASYSTLFLMCTSVRKTMIKAAKNLIPGNA